MPSFDPEDGTDGDLAAQPTASSQESHVTLARQTAQAQGQRRPLRNKDGLANHIRRLRFEHNEMTQQQLAKAVSVTRQTIVALESGRYSPSLPLAIRIARVFGQRVEDVFDLA